MTSATSSARPLASSRRSVVRARGALLYALGCFLAVQLVLLVWIERSRPELRDPEYGYRLRRLQQRLAEEPGRPLILLLGTSRAEMGVRPEALPAFRLPDGRAPLLFNYGISGIGPEEEFVYLRRLLDEGIRPTCVLVEVFPAQFWHDCPLEDFVQIRRLGWHDLGSLHPYCTSPLKLYQRWFVAHWAPWSANRFCLLGRYAPGWLPQTIAAARYHWLGQDRSGWLPAPPGNAEFRRSQTELTGREAKAALQNLAIGPQPDRILQGLLALCRREGIPAALLVMPEAGVFRGWYSARSRDVANDYLARLSGDFHVPLLDARDWVGDEHFIDAHHLGPEGAAVFTERLGREWLIPLLESQLQPGPFADARLVPASQGR